MKRELERKEREKDRKHIENHTHIYEFLGSSEDEEELHEDERVKAMCFPYGHRLSARASVDPPPRWSLGQTEAVLGKTANN